MTEQLKRKTHVLVECPELIASVKVGVLNALAILENNTLQTRFCRTSDMQVCDLQWADILITVRGCEQMSLRIVEEAKRLGRFIVYFLDDDLLNLPNDTQAYQFFNGGNHQRFLRDILGYCDALWGVNTLIRDSYLSYCGRPRWIYSRVPVIDMPTCQQESDTGEIRVLYAGSIDHTNMIRQVIVPAMLRVLGQIENISFTFIGADPGIRHNRRVRYIPFFHEYNEYRKYVENGGFQIGLAPVRTSHFYQCKYYNKFVEYTSIGAVGIYTDCPLYRQIVTCGENGVLCENTPEKWADAVIQLAKKQNLRYSCYEQATTLLKSEFRADIVARQIVDQLPELVDYRAPIFEQRQIHLPNAKVLFYQERARYLFHVYGFLAIPCIAWKIMKKIGRWMIGRCG